MAETDEELKALLDKFEQKQTTKVQGFKEALHEEDAWIRKFEDVRRRVIRPTLESLGEQIRKRGHDFRFVETDFRRDNRAIPDEASIRMDIFLSTDTPRTAIGIDRRPFVSFTTQHRDETVHVALSDMTAAGGVISKVGELPLDKIDAFLVRDRFIALFNRLSHK